MLTSIGRASALTRGSQEIVVDSGQTEVPKHSPARYCFYNGACRKIIDNGTVGLASNTEYTSSSSCTSSVPCTVE
jgi:hypothetical protein